MSVDMLLLHHLRVCSPWFASDGSAFDILGVMFCLNTMCPEERCSGSDEQIMNRLAQPHEDSSLTGD